MSREIFVLSIEESERSFARLVESDARSAVAARGSFAFAIPGGSAASALLPALIGAPVDWRAVEVFWVDERDVPADDERSNARLAREVWLNRLPVAVRAIHELRGDPEAYERLLVSRFGRPPRLDLVLLGVGEDGHVASLFPGHPLLDARERYVASLDDAPKPPSRRLTLTLPALAAARRVVVFAAGGGKAAAIREALSDPASPLPLALVLRAAHRATILLDAEAASKMGGG
ncbi:MAG TPA: 6-phosphogluconolactonase [Candidatus Polarisedimenticolaceae bacterium]|nr:6-phosphogluconolactonase [Candidatus Polarisedimenticolaceae bacterium]